MIRCIEAGAGYIGIRSSEKDKPYEEVVEEEEEGY